MKIVNRKQFLEMPKETVFSLYSPCFFEDLRIKMNDPDNWKWKNDFLSDPLIAKTAVDDTGGFFEDCQRMEKGENVAAVFDETERDGLFIEDQLFAIYEKEDVENLINRLKKTLGEK